jgi:hypothetical protein
MQEIYDDYPIALKFVVKNYLDTRDYHNVLKEFTRDNRAKLSNLADSVGDTLGIAGYFVEVEVKGDTGQKIGTRYVFIEHETGPEILLPLLPLVATYLGMKVVDIVVEKALDGVMDHLTSFMKTQWDKLVQKKKRIDHVEIHTEDKGTMRIPFKEFNSQQIICLIEKFPTISHLRECNKQCFNGLLLEASIGM